MTTGYTKLLHVAKIRQAHMLFRLNRHHDAHELLKQSFSSQSNNLNLRAFYTHFLIQSNLPKPAKEFVFATLKDHDKHDVYSLCAAAENHYYQARESRDTSSEGVKERKRNFQRSSELYDKALYYDPTCAVAAQGLAIVIAEDALGTLGGSLGHPAPDESQRRLKNAREALEVFAKVRESLDDGCVYANMGHCYFVSDDYDRAIESVSDLYFVYHLHLSDFLVGYCFQEVVSRTQRSCVTLSLPCLVREGEQGSVVQCHEYCSEVCSICKFLIMGIIVYFSHSSSRHIISNLPIKSSCIILP